jgi:hypothetical protein
MLQALLGSGKCVLPLSIEAEITAYLEQPEVGGGAGALGGIGKPEGKAAP